MRHGWNYKPYREIRNFINKLIMDQEQQDDLQEDTTSMEEKIDDLTEEADYECDECLDTGFVTIGEFDNIEEVRCYKCKYYNSEDYECTNVDAFAFPPNTNLRDMDGQNVQINTGESNVTIPYNFGCIHFEEAEDDYEDDDEGSLW